MQVRLLVIALPCPLKFARIAIDAEICHATEVLALLSIVIGLVSAGLASGRLFKHQRVTTYLALAGAVFEIQWLFISWVQRSWLHSSNLSVTYAVGSIIFLLLWSTQYRQWNGPAWRAGAWRRELVVLVCLLPVLLSASLVAAFNGYVLADQSWVTHGYFNGDTVTLGALVEKSLQTSSLVTANPFAGNGTLEYPTLVHGALADFFQVTGIADTWLTWLTTLTIIQILITIPLFWLLWDIVVPEPEPGGLAWLGIPSRWLVSVSQGVIVLTVLGVSWDNYVYPQSHFWLTAIFLSLIAQLHTSVRLKGYKQWLTVTFIFITTLVLLGSNAILGTAAVCCLVAWLLLRAQDRGRTVGIRAIALLGALLCALAFLLWTPGEPALGWPSISYTAAVDMMRLGPLLVVLIWSTWVAVSLQALLSFGVALLMSLALVTYFGSTRDIVIANAMRFFYTALLVGFPLLLRPLLQASLKIRRELRYVTHTWSERFSLFVVSVVAVVVLLLPAAASVLQTHDALLLQDSQHVTVAEQAALHWIKTTAAPEAVFVASPAAPWSIPFFTGRAITRADFWLSPSDKELATVQAIWSGGSPGSVTRLAQAGDYLYLKTGERRLFNDLNTLSQVFGNEAVTIYSLR